MSVQSGAGNRDQAQTSHAFTGAAQAAAASMGDGVSINRERPASAADAENNTWSFLGAGLPELVSVKSGGADVRTLMATISTILAKDNAVMGDYHVDTTSVDNTVETGWRYSAVAVMVRHDKSKTVAFYPMLLQSTESHPLEAETKDIGMQTVQVLHVPSDGLDRQYVDRIAKAVIEANPGFSLMDAGGMVVPSSIDAASEDQIRPILANATRACVTAMVEANPGFVDLNLALRQDNTFQNVTLQVTTGDHSNVIGEPVRQDVVVTLTARKKQQEQQQQGQTRSVHQGSASESVVGSVRGFFDISFAPQNAGGGAYGNQAYTQQSPMARTRQFVKRLVVTDLHLPVLATLPSALMMLFTTTVAGEPSVSDSVFFQNFKNHRLEVGNKDKSGFDPTDVGVLNLISNVDNVPAGQPVPPKDLKTATATHGDFATFMQSVFVPEWSLAIDVPRAGPNSWVLNVFSGAAAGNESAIAELIRAADKLTNGKFSNHFFAGRERVVTTNMIFSEVSNTVHLGYYMKQTGEGQVKRDIRHIDYLYILNRYGQIDKTPLDWATSFLTDRANPYQRMSRRKEIIEAAVAGKVYFTDFAERHTFSDHFIVSLIRSCVESGLQPAFQYNNPLAGATAALTAPSFTQGGLLSASSAQAGFTTVGAATTGGMYNNPVNSRWLS